MQEEMDSDFVHFGAFGKRKGLAHEPPEALAQGVVEAFDVIGGAFGVRGLMLAGRQGVVITLQMIGMQWPRSVRLGYPRPQATGGGIIARSQGVGDDLASTPTQRQPEPDHPPAAVANERPQLIQFQRLPGFGRQQGRFQRTQGQGFFLSQALTVLRATPKVRLSPRRLLRSW